MISQTIELIVQNNGVDDCESSDNSFSNDEELHIFHDQINKLNCRKLQDIKTYTKDIKIQKDIKKDIEISANCSKKCISQYTTFDVIDAQSIIRDVIESTQDIEYEDVSINDAYGRILFEDIYSRCNVPSFRASAKHGYAIKADDERDIKMYKVLKAGTTSPLEPGTCVWVKTGAPIPDETTAVVQVGNTKMIKKCDDNTTDNADNTDDTDNEREEEEIEITINPKEGENIRPIGCEIKMREKILDKYTRIGLAAIGLLASCGYNRATVVKLPSIGILSIGDNLEEPGETLRPKHVYDSNRLTLITLLKEEGFDALDFGIVNDSNINIIQKILEVVEKANVLVITGSTNDRDILKFILTEYFNATIYFGNVNVKPGKSTFYATCMRVDGIKHFLCLSGNPATVLIVAHLFLLPLLNEMRRNYLKTPVTVKTEITTEYQLHSRPSYMWAQLIWKDWKAKQENTFSQNYKPSSKLKEKRVNETEHSKKARMSRTSSLLKCRKANALLMLPRSAESLQSLEKKTLVSALFLASK